MENKKTKSKATIRRASKHGETRTKMMTFKVDIELLEYLDKEPNKGRLINNLLRQHYNIKEESDD